METKVTSTYQPSVGDTYFYVGYNKALRKFTHYSAQWNNDPFDQEMISSRELYPGDAQYLAQTAAHLLNYPELVGKLPVYTGRFDVDGVHIQAGMTVYCEKAEHTGVVYYDVDLCCFAVSGYYNPHFDDTSAAFSEDEIFQVRGR